MLGLQLSASEASNSSPAIKLSPAYCYYQLTVAVKCHAPVGSDATSGSCFKNRVSHAVQLLAACYPDFLGCARIQFELLLLAEPDLGQSSIPQAKRKTVQHSTAAWDFS